MRFLAYWAVVMLASAPLAAGKPSAWKDNHGVERSPAIPPKVRKFVINAQACAHFSGEEGYDAERAAFLKKMIAKNCKDLDKQHDRLLTRYRGNAEVEVIIAEVWEPFL